MVLKIIKKGYQKFKKGVIKKYKRGIYWNGENVLPPATNNPSSTTCCSPLRPCLNRLGAKLIPCIRNMPNPYWKAGLLLCQGRGFNITPTQWAHGLLLRPWWTNHGLASPISCIHRRSTSHAAWRLSNYTFKEKDQDKYTTRVPYRAYHRAQMLSWEWC